MFLLYYRAQSITPSIVFYKCQRHSAIALSKDFKDRYCNIPAIYYQKTLTKYVTRFTQFQIRRQHGWRYTHTLELESGMLSDGCILIFVEEKVNSSVNVFIDMLNKFLSSVRTPRKRSNPLQIGFQLLSHQLSAAIWSNHEITDPTLTQILTINLCIKPWQHFTTRKKNKLQKLQRQDTTDKIPQHEQI